MIDRARKDYVQLSFLYVLAVLAVLFLSTLSESPSSSTTGIAVSPYISTYASSSLFTTIAFSNVQIKGKAYVVYDLTLDKVIASKNADQVLPLASVTKVMTAFTARTHSDKDALITIEPGSIDGGYDLGLKKGQMWHLNELLKYMLVFSSNDAALEVADTIGGRPAFVRQMNGDAKILGLTSMSFTNPAGLDVGDQLGGQGTALDVAKLIGIAHNRFPELFDATTHKRATVVSSTGNVSGVPNTNQDIENLIEAEASKTGFTDSAGGNLTVIVDVTVGHPVAIVVLGSTREERFSDMEKLYKTLKESISNTP